MSCYEISLSFIFKQQMCEHFLRRGNKETMKERPKERKRKERKTDELMTKTCTKKDKEVMLERKRKN